MAVWLKGLYHTEDGMHAWWSILQTKNMLVSHSPNALGFF